MVLLQRLREYSERLDLPPALYREMPVRYLVDLRADGAFDAFTDTSNLSSRSTKRGTSRRVPFIVRTSATRPLLFSDTSEYTFGIGAGDNPARTESRHAAYLELITECAAVTGLDDARAVEHFLKSTSREALGLPADFDATGLITFRVDGRFIVDHPDIQRFWAMRFAPEREAEDEDQQCFVCGQALPLRPNVPELIEGIPGGQTRKALVFGSSEESPFISYGITTRACASCEELTSKALNHLLADERSRIRFGDSIYVFWTRDRQEHNIFRLLEEAAPSDVKTFLDSVRAGQRARIADPNRFYAVALSAAGGRAVVREWIDTTLPEAEEALARWFDRQAITDMDEDGLRYFGVRALAGATVRDLRDIAAPTTRALLRSAFTGAPLPPDLMAAAVRRTIAERRVTASQAALIKTVLASRAGHEEEKDSMTELAPNQDNIGYHCGRLLAVLDSIQRAAIPGVKAGIVDRYFGSASSSPASVFGRLVQGAQPHLSRLERDRPAAQVALQRRLEEVLQHIQSFPRVLKLEDQGYFALGYYHQRADDRARARAAKERRQAGTASVEDEGEEALDPEADTQG